MVPIIADTSFVKLGEIDDYISFIWTARYYSPGDFELVCPITDKTLSLLKKDYYVMRTDVQDVGIIERVQFNSDADTETMIVSGRFLSCILGRRIVAVQSQFDNKTPGQVLSGLITDAIINPSISARAIAGFTFSDLSGATERLSVQYTGKNLLDVVSDLCQTYGLGFRVVLNSGGFQFRLYKGTDHSHLQAVNPVVVFSPEYDNLLSSEYLEDYSTIVTDVLVAGEGEGLARKTIWADQAVIGLARYEQYVDARNASTNNGQISDQVYLAQLQQEGTEYFTRYTTGFSGTVYLGGYQYRDDFDIGDIVTVENTRWGIGFCPRIVEVIESMSESGEYSVVPTFGA